MFKEVMYHFTEQVDFNFFQNKLQPQRVNRLGGNTIVQQKFIIKIFLSMVCHNKNYAQNILPLNK